MKELPISVGGISAAKLQSQIEVIRRENPVDIVHLNSKLLYNMFTPHL